MSECKAVYTLTCSMIDPRLSECFVIAPEAQSVLGHEQAVEDLQVIDASSIFWKTQSLAEHWRPMPVVGPVNPFNDYPCLELTEPVFSRRAVDALGDILTENGDLLRLDTTIGEYYLYVVQTKIDALNVLKSDFTRCRKDEAATALGIDFFDFHQSRLANATIFRIPELPNYTLVTDRFKDRVERSGLNGFEFAKVWPLPEGTDWFKEHRGWQKQQKATKLAGEAIVLRFSLHGDTPSLSEREQAAGIETALAAKLKVDSLESPYRGSIEVAEFAEGEFRIFCTCPSAETLSEFLAPWLETVPWAGDVSLTKRFGNLYDKKAKEKRVAVRASR
jgi:hypothetical protein